MEVRDVLDPLVDVLAVLLAALDLLYLRKKVRKNIQPESGL